MPTKLRVDACIGNQDYTDAVVVIVGAGISGMCMAIDLIKRNQCHNFVILEKSSGVGGTWRDNKYPGCSCDGKMPSYWEYGLYRYIRFNSAVEEAKWDDQEMKWHVSVKVSRDKDSQFTSSYVLDSDFLISAVGQLNIPQAPDIPGLQDFRGKVMHSARWDCTYDFSGKRVAIIGNSGATSAQVVPEVAQVASHLTVFQRTPNWVIPRHDTRISAFQQALLTYIPPLRMRKRALNMDFRESFYAAVSDSASGFAEQIRHWCSQGMQAHLSNKPQLWAKLTPDYAPGYKRVIIADDYYPALARENVDLETRRISRITNTGIEVEEGVLQEYDFIILATGFKTVEFLYPIRIHGSQGRPLSEIWREGPSAFKGVTVEDLPNFGMVYGPNTSLGHNSIILMIEAQSRYLSALVGEVLRARLQGKTLVIKPKPSASAEYNHKLQEMLTRTSFADSRCRSWYKTEQGKITSNWSGTVVDYQRQMSQVSWTDYEVDGTAKDAIKSRKVTHLGRVREESSGSYTSLLLTSACVLAVMGGLLLRGSSLLRAH
ncbi:hypothetical protein AOCH_002641 [Aspergillus ochraceoroseus]|uniref:Flavin-binding monooxygenase n=1 Tax=Aspergillus ochraceoroseus TaxID=138278 RepID=A0A0F8UB51_9EURO|nr:hypothetical protein AOCH_002641 [Aspergillus ochraceoroseus]